MWLIMDERERVDIMDEYEGQHVQNMVSYAAIDVPYTQHLHSSRAVANSMPMAVP